jgi:hypothetical protein
MAAQEMTDVWRILAHVEKNAKALRDGWLTLRPTTFAPQLALTGCLAAAAWQLFVMP